MAILTCNSPLHPNLKLHDSFYSGKKVEDDVGLPRIGVRSLTSNSTTLSVATFDHEIAPFSSLLTAGAYFTMRSSYSEYHAFDICCTATTQ